MRLSSELNLPMSCKFVRLIYVHSVSYVNYASFSAAYPLAGVIAAWFSRGIVQGCGACMRLTFAVAQEEIHMLPLSGAYSIPWG